MKDNVFIRIVKFVCGMTAFVQEDRRTNNSVQGLFKPIEAIVGSSGEFNCTALPLAIEKVPLMQGCNCIRGIRYKELEQYQRVSF